jgi:hypothetical protein
MEVNFKCNSKNSIITEKMSKKTEISIICITYMNFIFFSNFYFLKEYVIDRLKNINDVTNESFIVSFMVKTKSNLDNETNIIDHKLEKEMNSTLDSKGYTKDKVCFVYIFYFFFI